MDRGARNDDGSWYLGRGPGRGIWWCRGTNCRASLTAGQLARALRGPVSESDAYALGALETNRVQPER
jgi:hypothetical protein